MAQRIVIDPVTRIEGHAKITIHLDDAGQVDRRPLPRHRVPRLREVLRGPAVLGDAGAHGAHLRHLPGQPPARLGQGRRRDPGRAHPAGRREAAPADEPGPDRPVARAELLPPIAPDLLLGLDSDPAKRNIFGLIAADPELARGGIRLRQFGQEIIELLGGKKIHPAWVGPRRRQRAALTAEGRDQIRGRIPEALAIAAARAGAGSRRCSTASARRSATFGNFPSLFMGLVGADGELGALRRPAPLRRRRRRRSSPTGSTRALRRVHRRGGRALDSYLKSPYYKPLGYPDGIYRVGPLARLNVCDAHAARRWPTRSWANSASRSRGAVTSLVPLPLRPADRDPGRASSGSSSCSTTRTCSRHARPRPRAAINQLEGVGVSEAPRGTLFHHYKVDENGLITRVNLIIATGQNNLAMNRTVSQIARHLHPRRRRSRRACSTGSRPASAPSTPA